MMKQYIKVLCLISLNSLLSCDNSDNIKPGDVDTSGNIILNNLAPGQLSRYVNYTTTCDDFNGDLNFNGDTLEVKVIERDEDIYFHESLTEGSVSYSITSPDEVVHKVIIQASNILIPERQSSYLFYFYGNDTIRLNPNKQVILTQQNCKIFQRGLPFVGNDIGLVDNFALGDYRFKNKTVVSCVPILNLDAYLIYDNQRLYVSHAISSSEFNGETSVETISGWMLLSNDK